MENRSDFIPMPEFLKSEIGIQIKRNFPAGRSFRGKGQPGEGHQVHLLPRIKEGFPEPDSTMRRVLSQGEENGHTPDST